jgi:arginine utilization protein RocB
VINLLLISTNKIITLISQLKTMKNKFKITIQVNIYNLDIIIPPYNGFGDENDSLGYVYRLVPKPPKKDFFKWVDN